MFYTIYKIIHKSSNKIYIGKHQTKNLDDGYMGSGKYLKHAQEKYGLDQFEKKILHVFDNEEEMNSKEAELVTEEFCSRKDTYNICPGGKGGFGYINSLPRTKEWRHKISQNHQGMKNLVQYKSIDEKRAIHKKISNTKKGCESTFGMLGKIHSKETKIKMSSSHSGKGNSQYGTMWITDGVKNKKIKKDSPIPNSWKKGRSISKR